jgi:hypothetical protein
MRIKVTFSSHILSSGSIRGSIHSIQSRDSSASSEKNERWYIILPALDPREFRISRRQHP